MAQYSRIFCLPLFCPKIEEEIEQDQIHGYSKFLQETTNSEIPFYCSNHRSPKIERDSRAKMQQLYVKLLFLRKGAINNLIKALSHKLHHSLIIFSQRVRHFYGGVHFSGNQTKLKTCKFYNLQDFTIFT